MSLSSRLSVDDVPGGGKPEADAVALLDVDEALTIISRSGPLSAILVLQGEVRAGEGGISEVASAMKAMGKKPTALSRLIPRPPPSTPTQHQLCDTLCGPTHLTRMRLGVSTEFLNESITSPVSNPKHADVSRMRVPVSSSK
jgi:hypothetical protein